MLRQRHHMHVPPLLILGPEQMVTVKSSLKESQMEELDAMADAIVNSMK